MLLATGWSHKTGKRHKLVEPEAEGVRGPGGAPYDYLNGVLVVVHL